MSVGLSRWPVLVAVHAAVLLAAMMLLWVAAQPVQSSSMSPGLSWPFTLAATLVPGLIVGVGEGALLRSARRPVAGYFAMAAASVAALWIPLVMVSHSPSGVIPVTTADLVGAAVTWLLFWAATTAAALVVVSGAWPRAGQRQAQHHS